MSIPMEGHFAHSLQPGRRDDVTLDHFASRFARREAMLADAEIDALIAQALQHWQLDDATFWQRVRIRMRRLRALARGEDLQAYAQPAGKGRRGGAA